MSLVSLHEAHRILVSYLSINARFVWRDGYFHYFDASVLDMLPYDTLNLGAVRGVSSRLRSSQSRRRWGGDGGSQSLLRRLQRKRRRLPVISRHGRVFAFVTPAAGIMNEPE